MKTKVLLIALAFIAFIQPNTAKAEAKVGEAIPHDLQSLDQDGKAQNFDSIKGSKGLVLVFVRSVDWCPYCQAQLIELNESYADIKSHGYELASISYDDVEKIKKFDEKREIVFPMLSDEGSSIIKAFGILNTEKEPGSKAYGIPNPAVYIISPDGVIENYMAEASFKDRPKPEEILGFLAK